VAFLIFFAYDIYIGSSPIDGHLLMITELLTAATSPSDLKADIEHDVSVRDGDQIAFD
jgi:hypothetical protein